MADLNGQFRFESLAGGSKLRVRSDDEVDRKGTHSPVTVRGGETDLVLTVRPNASRMVTIEVTDDAGKPVPEAKVTFSVWSAGGGIVMLRQTDEHGRMKDAAWLDSSYRVSVEAEGYGKVSLGARPAAEWPDVIKVRLTAATAFIEGTVVDAAGKPVADVEVQAYGDKTPSRTARTDMDGHFRITGVVSGDEISIYVRQGRKIVAQATATAGGEPVELWIRDEPARLP
jgi:hypothetical protein